MQIMTDNKKDIDELSNDKVLLRYNRQATDTIMLFSIFDKTDTYNLTTGYNKGKRGHQNAFNAVHQKFTDEMTFWQVVDILDKMGMKIHTYCAMD